MATGKAADGAGPRPRTAAPDGLVGRAGLLAHLRESVTTGTWCSYSPAAPTAWEL